MFFYSTEVTLIDGEYYHDAKYENPNVSLMSLPPQKFVHPSFRCYWYQEIRR